MLLAGLILLGLSWSSLQSGVASLECFCPSCPETAVAQAGVASLGMIKLDIQGAVKKPGVYELQVGQRLADLVAAAGGFSDQADRLYVVKTLNLAKELKNQDKIYIPFFEETAAASNNTAIPQVGSSSSGEGVADSGLISVNTATAAQLQSLSGIGEVKSQAIIANRPYASLDELVTKKVISENLFNSLAEQISL